VALDRSHGSRSSLLNTKICYDSGLSNEAYRALKSGGHFFFNVWNEIAANDFANLVTQTLPALLPKDPPDFMARTPHGYFDKERIREDLVAAGFGAISIETRQENSLGASARELERDHFKMKRSLH
jgi:hypothetical protein